MSKCTNCSARHIAIRSPRARVYTARKTALLKRPRNFACEFAFRDAERLLRAIAVPVFSRTAASTPGPGNCCGRWRCGRASGCSTSAAAAASLALAAARRAPQVEVLAVDSNARAVECTRRGAELNGLTNVTVEFELARRLPGAGSFDLVLANPPYYADFQIARHFVLSGRAALRGGGTLLIVTKSPDWYRRELPAWFDEVCIERSKEYHVVRGRRRPGIRAEVPSPSGRGLG